ncbi:arsenate-mycothiol transferase ArsC [Pimelobacter simplex]|uniref:arsenate-mycothiol transferase ArsC n=1 Tax=Nocardioides simplex TaxID=2045 RepID=UPI00215036CF|nr:low molecular weight phosphatase family protein [Pimelobacter simplex]UUW88708.1 low molecular weight phosphatase family protein [Pimelobacter simplex]UUW98213.1 low molecular weight phosphatase family protein [Pimelobacter simplex]
MTARPDQRAAQVAAMAHPGRVRLLSAALGSETGEATAASLAAALTAQTSTSPDGLVVQPDLDVMVEVGLLSIHGDGRYRPTHDALVRFGSLAAGAPTVIGQVGDHERILQAIAVTLGQRFAGVVAAETVRDFVWESYDLIASRARVRQFLPQLTERFAADRLDALASLNAVGQRDRDDVLFVCVRNAGRSQIAAALMRDRVAQSVRVRAAGSVPGSQLDPTVQQELARRGVDALTEFPRPLTDEVVRASGVVVTMGCGDACPIVPGRRYVDWPVDDPIGRPLREVQRIVDEISERVDQLIVEMGVSSDSRAEYGRRKLEVRD